MEENHHEKIIRSWNDNAEAWAKAISSNAIESRRVATDAAVVNTILRCGGTHVLDAGCGEGWLARTLSKEGFDVTGFDVSRDLIERARRERVGTFLKCSNDEFIADPYRCGHTFDVGVCNFSLLSDEVSGVLKAIHAVTRPLGHLVIQTLHPCSSNDESRYEDGWREETFSGLPGHWSPMPWYFRTIGSWIGELKLAGWKIDGVEEPLYPNMGKPASLILIGMK